MAIGFGIASRNWWRAQIKGGVSPSFSLDFATISDDFTFTRSSFATRVNEFGLIETVSSDVPRIDYTNGEGAFLLEPQSTNLITYSEDFSDASWAKLGNSAFGFVTGVAPDGNTSVYEITSNGTGGNLQYIISGLSVNTQYTLSFYVKQLSPTTLVQSRVLSLTGGSGGSNLTQVNYQDQLVTDEWVRITHTFTTDDTLGNYIVYVSNALTSGESLQFWGAQLEQLPYATSYIPTNGTTVTRAAETCVDATPTINSEEGVLYAEISALADDLKNRSLALSDGTASNRVNILFGTSTNSIRAIVLSGGAKQFDQQYIVTSTLDTHKIALKYKENDFALWIDGVKVSTDNVGSVFAEGTLTELDFTVGTSVFPFYGNTKDLKIYDKALTDDELITITSI